MAVSARASICGCRAAPSHELAEHNVIIGGSWPVQSFGGEFRYNLVVDSGHTFWRSSANGTLIHHNLFVHATGTNTQYDARDSGVQRRERARYLQQHLRRRWHYR